jgi:hypothetical protein
MRCCGTCCWTVRHRHSPATTRTATCRSRKPGLVTRLDFGRGAGPRRERCAAARPPHWSRFRIGKEAAPSMPTYRCLIARTASWTCSRPAGTPPSRSPSTALVNKVAAQATAGWFRSASQSRCTPSTTGTGPRLLTRPAHRRSGPERLVAFVRYGMGEGVRCCEARRSRQTGRPVQRARRVLARSDGPLRRHQRVLRGELGCRPVRELCCLVSLEDVSQREALVAVSARCHAGSVRAGGLR